MEKYLEKKTVTNIDDARMRVECATERIRRWLRNFSQEQMMKTKMKRENEQYVAVVVVVIIGVGGDSGALCVHIFD